MHILRQSIYTYTISHKQYTCDRLQSNTREYLRFRAIFMYFFCHSYWISSYLLLTNSITANNSLKTLWIITGACNHTNRRNFPPFIIVIVHISKFTLQSELQQITQGKKCLVIGHSTDLYTWNMIAILANGMHNMYYINGYNYSLSNPSRKHFSLR